MALRFFYLLGYFFFWLVFFLFSKAVFLIYHQALAAELTPTQILGIFWHGLPLDLSTSAYLSLIPFLLLSLSAHRPYTPWLARALMAYTTLALFVVTVLCTSDLELFSIWGFRMDASPFNYVNTPKEMMASVGSSPLLLLILLNVLINVFFSMLYRHQLHGLLPRLQAHKHGRLPLVLATFGLLLPMRGGLQREPIDQSRAFFSNNHFANQAALNLPWNVVQALTEQLDADKHPYLYQAPAQADSLVAQLYSPLPTAADTSFVLLNQQRPNVILIIWESLTAKVSEPLGGLQEVTPRFTELSRQGLLFSRMYASGDRSDKGLVAILSGYPAQPIPTITNHPEKAHKLPHLSQRLSREGYHTSFYYGGDLAFANLRNYLRFGQWQHVTGITNFTKEERSGKWGAPDGTVLARMAHELQQAPTPFFSTVFTLSSHEPFDLPPGVAPRFGGKSAESKFLSAHYYTDSVLGAFVDQARRQPWWDNTLLIILADHGHTDPGLSQVYEPKKFHIPMLWLGGALKEKGTIWPHALSQTDLIASLLGQLQLESEEFPWSRDVFIPGSRPFAPYFFKDGVGFVTDSSWLSWDNIGGKLIGQQGAASEAELPYARSYLQTSFADFLKK
ncbi:LTA synthase family protein [Cesiribacter andamanensis]|uniref:Lipoteichoic acid synthase 2 n=1 Tax=Cesiribacter andamanensis AMV16 TaxID=1279009 RepID=M7N5G1_9BACT|nr:alkaline phosphatase family protein [Cesiribacter andamanensis]EMR02466.1 Lipoteichoic acid synthase 2 [Cesiribacter andamanensis AMV16]